VRHPLQIHAAVYSTECFLIHAAVYSTEWTAVYSNVNAPLQFPSACPLPSSLATPNFYLEALISLFFILSHRIQAKHNQYHIAGVGASRGIVKSQLRHRLKSPGGKLQDRSCPPPLASYGSISSSSGELRDRSHPPPLAPRGSVSSGSGELRERSSPPSSAPCGSVSSGSGELRERFRRAPWLHATRTAASRPLQLHINRVRVDTSGRTRILLLCVTSSSEEREGIYTYTIGT
jgi:hypothetical protein